MVVNRKIDFHNLKVGKKIHTDINRIKNHLNGQHLLINTLPTSFLSHKHHTRLRGGGFGHWLKHNVGAIAGATLGTGAVLLAPMTGGASLGLETAVAGAEASSVLGGLGTGAYVGHLIDT
tara:strand:- start:72 stop:431 length:360 start_codon:yes stop_codon:yes gene_type:complete